MTLHENGVEIRILDVDHSKKLKMIGFIHNPSTSPAELIKLAETWLLA